MSDLKMSDGVEVSEILKGIDKHDQPILELLMLDRNELTKIQISKILKRSRSDVGYSLRRLKSGSHINQESRYGRWYAVNYDYESEVASKRPDEAAGKIKSMEQEIAQLKADKAELVDRLSLRPVSEITPDFFVTGKKILAWNGYFFEAEWDGEDWCSIGGDDFDFFMTLPSEPLQKHKG